MSNNLVTANEYGFSSTEGSGSLIQVEQTRATAEVQAAFVIAKRYPRDENVSFNKIMKSCERPFLAEQAMYCYPRGGTVVTGPSIRLAEVLAQSWGNVDCGVREITQGAGMSVAEAYAIDLETNTRITKVFHVPHERHTKKGKVKLTDPRDVYEMVANQGARRMRACILGIIPGDIVDAAVDKCKHTLSHGKEPMADRVRKMVSLFDEQGIKIEQIEKRLGHKLDAIIEAELITLRGIYKSLKDGMAKREDFFDMGNSTIAQENLNDIISSKKIEKPEPEEKPEKVELTEYDKIKKQLLSAKSVDTLDIAADLIGSIHDEKEKDELINIYKNREKEFY